MKREIREIVLRELSADIGQGDLTTEAIIKRDKPSKAIIIAREDFIVSGLEIVKFVFRRLDPKAKFKVFIPEGKEIKKGGLLLQINARAKALLKGERTALNFLQRLSGIATLTAKYAARVQNYPVTIRDTRKTTPGMRILEKFAVRCGGGRNHRHGLHDGILIKDNHIKLAGNISLAIKNIRNKYPRKKIEVEVSSLQEIKEALACKAEIILLDNMRIGELKKAISLINKRAKIEISGGVSLKNIEGLAPLGADYISIGRLTHSAPAVDISLEIVC